MSKYLCQVCGYVYDESEGDSTQDVAPGTKFEELPETWCCPLCGVDKSNFEEI